MIGQCDFQLAAQERARCIVQKCSASGLNEVSEEVKWRDENNGSRIKRRQKRVIAELSRLRSHNEQFVSRARSEPRTYSDGICRRAGGGCNSVGARPAGLDVFRRGDRPV